MDQDDPVKTANFGGMTGDCYPTFMHTDTERNLRLPQHVPDAAGGEKTVRSDSIEGQGERREARHG